MQLSGSLRGQLQQALLGAFPTRAALAQMVSFGLDQNLAAIADGANLTEVVFALLEWAVAHNRLADLVQAAAAANPEHAGLAGFAAQGAFAPGGPAAPSAAIHPALPNPTAFLGRAREVALLSQMLHAPRGKIVLLVGLGGFGKSTLAAHVARHLAGTPFRAVFWSSTHLVEWGLEYLLRDLAALVPEIGQQPNLQQQRAVALDFLRANPTLLLCDQVEELTNPTEQQRVVSFLTSVDPAQGSRVLLTSRQEDEWLQSLAARPGSQRMALEGLSEADAVALLRDCGRDSGIGPLTTAAESELKALVKAVFYSPKLIELLIGLGDYARIRQVAAKLPLNIRNARQALLAAGFERLDQTPGALALLQQASVFVPSADYAALAAVCASGLPEDADCDEALDAACATALLSRDTAGDGTTRYRLHALVGRYLEETAAYRPPEALLVPAAAAHTAHYLALAETAAAALSGPEQATWLARLEIEHDNLRKAREWAIAQQQEETEARLLAALWGFMYLRGYLREGRAWLDAALAHTALPAALRADLLRGAGILAEEQGDYGQAVRHCEEALRLYQELGDRRAIANALNSLGVIADKQGDLERARQCYEESLAGRRALDNKRGVAMSLNNLATLAHRQGDIAQAEQLFAESLRLQRELENARGAVLALNNLGELAVEQGAYAPALAYFQESLAICRQLGSQRDLITCLAGFAMTLAGQGRAEPAAHLFGTAAALREASGTAPYTAAGPTYERLRAAARAQLGEAAWAGAWTAGQALSAEEAAAYVAEALVAS